MTTISQPSSYPYHKHDLNTCAEPSFHDPLFMENINDIANTMSEVCKIFDLESEKYKKEQNCRS